VDVRFTLFMSVHCLLQIDQSMFTVTPAECDISPAMVLVFELFLLRTNGEPFDQAVGYGVFPLVNTGTVKRSL
jgi:hypothetical protein